MKPQFNKFTKFFRYLGLFLGSILFFVQLINSAINLQQNTFASIDWTVIGFAFLVTNLIYYVQILIWLDSMNSIGVKIPLTDALYGYWISFIPRYIPGTIWGYFSRSDWFSRKKNIPHSYFNTGSIIETLIVVIGGLATVIASSNSDNNSFWRFFTSGLMILLSGILFTKFSHKVVHLLNRFKVNMISMPVEKPIIKNWYRASLLSLLNWALFGLVLLLVILALPLQLNGAIRFLFIHSINIYSTSWLFGFVILFIPSGLGIRESVMAILLSTMFGFSFDTCVIIAVLIRLLNLLTELIWIMFAVFILRQK